MLIRSSDGDCNAGLRYSDVTPEALYLHRRKFLTAGAATAAGLLWPGRTQAATLSGFNATGPLRNLRGDTAVPRSITTSHNNFYEFGTGKNEPVKNAQKWTPNAEWPIRIDGDVKAAKTVNLADVMKLGLEERIYRMRCVEGWSIVVPWIGVPLASLLKSVEPTGKAKYVAFESYYDSKIMLSTRQAGINFPYVEGLRIDEALHPMTLLAVGLYGVTMPNQNGAPVRLVVPWKYGFKSIKSIVRIRLQESVPATSWNRFWPEAYGFYSNVNPNRDHPGWSQAIEDRLDGSGVIRQGRKLKTEIFNGYGAQVAGLYNGMDLIRNY